MTVQTQSGPFANTHKQTHIDLHMLARTGIRAGRQTDKLANEFIWLTLIIQSHLQFVEPIYAVRVYLGQSG